MYANQVMYYTEHSLRNVVGLFGGRKANTRYSIQTFKEFIYVSTIRVRICRSPVGLKISEIYKVVFSIMCPLLALLLSESTENSCSSNINKLHIFFPNQ